MTERINDHQVDKSLYPEGPWMSEPDRVQWTDKATGYPCLIVRNASGALCGYVGVPSDHPSYRKPYDDVSVEVHGGLTYSNACQEDGPICNIPAPGEPADVWWLGFDCAHGFDVIPGMPTWSAFAFGGGSAYRDIAYVTGECASLAAQLRSIADKERRPVKGRRQIDESER